MNGKENNHTERSSFVCFKAFPRLHPEGEESVRNPVYVSFIEGLVDSGYQYPQLKGFIGQMPQNVKTFIKDFFIEEVLIALDLKNTDNQKVQ